MLKTFYFRPEKRTAKSVIELRSVTASDLDELCEIFRTSLLHDAFSEELMQFRISQDPDFDPALNLAVIEEGKIVAFISATHPTKFPPKERSSTGWIKILVTSPQYRKRGYASLLYDRIIEEFKRRGVIEVRVSDRGNWHFWPGVDLRYEDGLDFFEKRGFTKEAQELDYSYDLRCFFYPRRVKRMKQQLMEGEKYDIRLAKPAEKGEIGAWIEEKFTVFWRNETEYAFDKATPSVVIGKDSRGKILGFATFNGVAPGRFGPAGVDPSMRGKGLGTVLLFDAFQAMKEEGREDAIVHWTDLLFYYTQVPGLSGVRHYWIMRRGL